MFCLWLVRTHRHNLLGLRLFLIRRSGAEALGGLGIFRRHMDQRVNVMALEIMKVPLAVWSDEIAAN
jgi:hypothetical protein